MLALWNEIGDFPSDLGEEFEKGLCQFFKCFVELSSEVIVFRTFSMLEVFYYCFNLLLSLFKVSISSLVSSCKLFQGICSLLLDNIIYSYIIVHSIYFKSFLSLKG